MAWFEVFPTRKRGRVRGFILVCSKSQWGFLSMTEEQQESSVTSLGKQHTLCSQGFWHYAKSRLRKNSRSSSAETWQCECTYVLQATIWLSWLWDCSRQTLVWLGHMWLLSPALWGVCLERDNMSKPCQTHLHTIQLKSKNELVGHEQDKDEWLKQMFSINHTSQKKDESKHQIW